MQVSDLAEKLRLYIGDNTDDLPEDFIINAYNYTINALPMVPRLEKLFSKHKQFNLDAHNHYKWSLSDSTGFRRISDIPMLDFYTSTGGEPCKLPICHVPVENFYKKNGLISLKKSGTPCEYTIETEDDNVWLVLDRPSDVPIIVDYIAYGFPKPVSSLDACVLILIIRKKSKRFRCFIERGALRRLEFLGRYNELSLSEYSTSER